MWWISFSKWVILWTSTAESTLLSRWVSTWSDCTDVQMWANDSLLANVAIPYLLYHTKIRQMVSASVVYRGLYIRGTAWHFVYFRIGIFVRQPHFIIRLNSPHESRRHVETSMTSGADSKAFKSHFSNQGSKIEFISTIPQLSTIPPIHSFCLIQRFMPGVESDIILPN